MNFLRAEIMCVGTELLLGEIVDTNAAFLAGELANLGINLYYKTTVGDNWLRLSAAFGIALSRSDLVIVSGGLGPTLDDITKEVLSAVVGHPLELRPEAYQHIEQYLTSLGRPVSPNNRRQAMLPGGAEMIPNPAGTAPGVWLEHQGKLIICLPGVPHELKSMMKQTVIPKLREREHLAPLHSKVLRFSGIGESALEEKVMDLIKEQTNPTLALYAGFGEVRMRLTCRASTSDEAEACFAPLEAEIKSRLAEHLYATGDATLEEMVGEALTQRGLTVGVAESCTGGLIGHRLTSVSGSSRYFRGGIVAYDNEVKVEALGVDRDLLLQHGAVSGEVALAMAEGVRSRLRTDFGIGVTGIAGPTGGTEEKPVGTVYIACVDARGQASVVHRLFRGDRDQVKGRAAHEGLWLLYETSTRHPSGH